MKIKLDLEKVNSKLHWTTLYSEKILLAVIGTLTMLAAGMDIYKMVLTLNITLADLFLLFIYAEIVGMVGAFYISNRIPVTLPIVIAMTALCRLIVLHSKDADPWVLIAEAGAILVLGGAAYIMSYKDKLSLEKEQLRKQNESS
jgi:protein PsiE|tara:strand:+ start:6095 stop:6526 length:432 start_codon:yes stop_codon:yes gene_type:complete